MPTEVDPRVTGAVIGTMTCVPERSPLSPDVVPFVPGAAGAEPADVPPVVAAESPRTPAETEPTVTGAVIGATTWVPEATPSEPLVVAPDAAGAEPAGAADVPPVVAAESPSTPAETEPTVTGAVIGATIWVPEATPSEPLVVAPDAAGAEPAEPAGAADVPPVVAAESPSTPAETEPTVTGAVIGATTWVPETTPSEPLVVAPDAAGAEPAGAAAVPPDVAEESPPTPTAVAPTLTGTDIGATT
ncbi:hypothetical protein [Paenarthrobacter ureafaciens]|uniref:hypothetical protein n=1 Tax=Paenarthrobacter ureafaciens TaxID=37931 RepID=UPI001FB333CB|nr:hypothetical protein [Paenarthrobacter ureafaciens]UOD80463.1 hypothetical protein MQZ73_15270 [Paenarthrobacter ureafaciens]WNZ03114.1 hypothetical protein PVT25_15900 [Paenarthrobacter ureafaciens]